MQLLVILAVLYGFAVASVSEASDCPREIERLVDLELEWESYISEKLEGAAVLPALKQFKTQSSRLARQLDELGPQNQMLAYFDPYFDALRESNDDAATAMPFKMLQWMSWAGGSFEGMAECMALAPVDVRGMGQISLGGSMSLMRYFVPEMFEAQVTIDETLREIGPGGPEGFGRFMRALSTINWFIQQSGGNFSQCASDLVQARRRNVFFRLRPHFSQQGDDLLGVLLRPVFSQMTISEARGLCKGG